MSASANTNSWLRAQRKSELTEIANNVGLKNYDTLKKAELEEALNDYLAANSTRLSSRSDLTGYFNSRSKALGPPVKKEKETVKEDVEKAVKVVKRRATKAADEIAAEVENARTAVVTATPRSISNSVARILPASPAAVAQFADDQTVAVRKRVTSAWNESGVSEVALGTRDVFSTVNAVILLVSAFELFYIRPEILADRYAFTIPAVSFLGTSDYPIYLPDMFLILTSSFWSPALTWFLTSFIIPTAFGSLINLSATSAPPGPRTRSRAQATEYAVDPLTFSIAKALVAFVVYGQGVTFGGLLSETSIERLNHAVYGGYKGVLTGAAITGVTAFYDAILRK